MKNILAAIDFSDTSISIFQYASKLAEELEATLTLVHVVAVPIATETGVISPSYSIPYNTAADRLKYFVTELPKEKGFEVPDVEINQRIELGAPAFSIPTIAEELDVDLIIMGTISKNTMFSRMVGTVTTATINNAKCPVLLLHKNTHYVKPTKIVFGVEMAGELEESLAKFNALNNKFKSFTEFINVQPEMDKSLPEIQKELVEELVEDRQVDYSFQIKQVQGDNPSVDVIDYCIFTKADMLVLIHHERNIFERLFAKSDSFEMASKVHLPVLIIPG